MLKSKDFNLLWTFIKNILTHLITALCKKLCFLRACQPLTVTICKRHLSDSKPNTSFARGIFLGELREDELFPYPDVLDADQKETISMMMEAGHSFFQVSDQVTYFCCCTIYYLYLSSLAL